MKVNWFVRTGFVGGVIKGSIEVEDSLEEHEIDELVLDDIWDTMSFDWAIEDE